MAQLIDLFVDQRVLFDIKILARNVCLGLVIIIIGNEIFHGILREKTPHFGADLCRKRFIRLDDQRRTVALCNDICHGEGFAGAGYAEQHLVSQLCFHPFGKQRNRLRLVACGTQITLQRKRSIQQKRHLPITSHTCYYTRKRRIRQRKNAKKHNPFLYFSKKPQKLQSFRAEMRRRHCKTGKGIV